MCKSCLCYLTSECLNASDSCMMGRLGLPDVFKKLKMDKDIVDTTKAEEYLGQHKEFSSDSSITAAKQIAFDSVGSKIFCLSLDIVEDLYLTSSKPVADELLTTRSDQLLKLADAIEKETDLICQLEYLVRKIPVRETKHSIQLIVQHLRFSSETGLITSEEVIFIRNDTPLLALGCYFQSLKLYESHYLFATNESAVICYFFTELCQRVGLDSIKLLIVEMKTLLSSSIKFPKLFSAFLPEVTGIITDKSDVDSAVDVFLNSECHPFPLTRIFVQESIYKDFKDILSWKCKSQQNVKISLKSNCTDAFKYDNKTIYLDYAGNVEETKNEKEQLIFIEAYRTVNELLSLLNKTQKQLCLSLWAGGVSEANEIALNVSTPIVWINDYYNFNGPNEVSQAVFDKTYQSGSVECDKASVGHLVQQQQAWSQQSFNERLEKVIKAFEFANADLGNIIKSKSKSYWMQNDAVFVQNKSMIMRFNLLIPIVSYYWTFDRENDVNHPKMVSKWLSIVKALINGSALAYRMGSVKDEVVDIFDKFIKCGLPVAETKYGDDDSSSSNYNVTYSYHAESVQTKVIWTSFGTTFAN